MTAYEELLAFGQDRIFDFFKNISLYDSQFNILHLMRSVMRLCIRIIHKIALRLLKN